MSISDRKMKNPVTKFYEFKSEKKKFVWFNKDNEAEKKEDKYEALPLPAYFVVVDELSKVTGFCKKAGSGIYSNEVHNLSSEPLTVRTFKGGYHVEGIWNDIKGDVGSLNGVFTKSVYALLVKSDNEHELVNISFSGASLGEWVDFSYNQSENIVAIMDTFEEKSNGGIKYNVPLFKKFKIKEDVLNEAIRIDEELLKPFFESKKNDPVKILTVSQLPPEDTIKEETPMGTPIENKQFAVENEIPEPDDDLPF